MYSFKRSLLAFVGLLILVGLLATLMPLVSRGQGNNPIVAQLQPRKFYLTQTTHTGGQALSACAAGYHMASLWEINDPSNLRYDTQQGLTRDDSGSGPPSDVSGWMRTGFSANVSNTPGVGNCQAWSSAEFTNYGSTAGLRPFWATSATNISPWLGGALFCNQSIPVWCVQD
jgi:hypothetical protein